MTWRRYGVCFLATAAAVLGASALDAPWRGGIAASFAEGSLHENLLLPELWGIEHGYIGAHLAAGRGFAGPYLDVLEPTAVMPPVLPAIYAAIFALAGYHTLAGFLLLLFVKVLVLAAGLWALIEIASEYSEDESRGRAIMALVVATFVAVYAPRRLLIQTYDEWFLFGALSLCLLVGLRLARQTDRIPWPAVAGWGVALGLMALCQPIVAFGLGVATGVLAFRPQQRHILAALAIAALTVAPWGVRNAIEFGSPMPVKSSLFFELYYGNVVSPQGIHREEEVIASGQHPFFAGPERQHALDAGEVAYFAEKREAFLNDLSANPGNYLSKVAYRIGFATLVFPYSAAHQSYFNPIVPALVKYLLYPLPLVALFAWWRRDPKDSRVAFLGAAYLAYLAPYIAIHYWLRYWVQVLPLVVVIVFLSLSALNRRHLAAITAMGGAAFLVFPHEVRSVESLQINAVHRKDMLAVYQSFADGYLATPERIVQIRETLLGQGSRCEATFVQRLDDSTKVSETARRSRIGCVVDSPPHRLTAGLEQMRIPSGLYVVGTVDGQAAPPAHAHDTMLMEWAAERGHRVEPPPIELQREIGPQLRTEYLLQVLGSDEVEIDLPTTLSFHQVYQPHVGPYFGISTALTNVRRWAFANAVPCERTFAQFLDDPGRVANEALRSVGGCIVAGPVADLPDGLFYRREEPVEYVVARWTGRGPVDHATLYSSVYQWLFRNQLKLEGPVTEVYDISREPDVETSYHFRVMPDNR